MYVFIYIYIFFFLVQTAKVEIFIKTKKDALLKTVLQWWSGACDMATSSEDDYKPLTDEQIVNIMANPNAGTKGFIGGA